MNAVDRWSNPDARKAAEEKIDKLPAVRAVKTEDEMKVDLEGFLYEDYYHDKPFKYIVTHCAGDRALYDRLVKHIVEYCGALCKPKITEKKMRGLVADYEKKFPSVIPAPEKKEEDENGFPGIDKFFGESDVDYAGYHCSSDGVFGNYKGEPVRICAHPIFISKRYSNIISNVETVDITYYQDGRYKTIHQVPCRELRNKTKLLSILGDYSVHVDPNSIDHLAPFLVDFDWANRSIIPRAQTTDVIGWMSDGSFVPFNGDIEVDAMSSDKDVSSMSAALHKKGEAKTWIDAVSEKRKDPRSVPMRLAIAASLASVMIEPMHRLPFWVHLRGKRDTGKTVTERVAATIWGKADLNDGWMRTMLGTNVGFERLAGFARHLPLCLNELQAAQQADKSFCDIVYLLCEGSGKIRGARGGGLQRTYSWRLIIISCGEDQVITSEEKGGANTRVIEIPLTESIYDDPQSFCANILDKHYGHVGPMFIEALKGEDMDALTQEWLEISKRWTAAGKARKQSDSGALLKVADRLAEKYIFKDGVLLSDENILQYLKSDDATDDDLACFETVKSLISGKINNFTVNGIKPDRGDVWGKITEEKLADQEYQWVFFDKKFFDPELKHRGYDVQRFVEWAKEHGYLITARDPKPGREYTQQKKLYTGANGTWCYVFKLPVEGDDHIHEPTPLTPEPEQMRIPVGFTDATEESESELPF